MTKLTFTKSLVASLLLTAMSSFQIPLYAMSDGNRFLDPERFADWEVVGPDGGDARAIAIDPKDKNRLYLTKDF